jgi:nucleoid-associated protein YgaU
MSEVSLKPSNMFFNGKVIVFDDGTEELVRNEAVITPSTNDKYYTVEIDDILENIAFKFYKGIVEEPYLYWFLIADANKIENPLDLTDWVGKDILIPDIILAELQ